MKVPFCFDGISNGHLTQKVVSAVIMLMVKQCFVKCSEK